MSNAQQVATRYANASVLISGHAEFLDQWDYDAQRKESDSWDNTTYLHYEISYYSNRLEIECHGPNSRLLIRRVCKEFGGKWNKNAEGDTFFMESESGIMPIKVSAPRKLVCTPRVVGSEEVEVPDYSVAIPKKKVTKDVIEWDCPPSLLEVNSDA